MLWAIQPDMVVIRNLAQVSPGTYTGDDLQLAGKLTAKLQSDRTIAVTVPTILGVLSYKLLPVELDNAAAYDEEIRVIAAAPAPAPDPEPAPVAAPEPPVAAPPAAPPPVVRPVARRPVKIVSPIGEGRCGGSNQPPCTFQSAKLVNRNVCPGDSFFVKRNGGECWSCPKGSERTILPVTGKLACKRDGDTDHLPVASKKRATGVLKNKCEGNYELNKLGGWCFRCPGGFERTLAAIDSPKACKRKIKARHFEARKVRVVGCPAPGFLHSRNGRCVLDERDELRIIAKDVLDEVKPLLAIAKDALLCYGGIGKFQGFEKALKARDLEEVVELLAQGGCLGKVRQAAAANGYDTVTVGIAGDASLGIGGNGELGVAIDNRDRYPALLYSNLGYSLGWSAGAGASLTMGFAKGPNHKIAGKGQGFAFSAVALGGGGVGIGFDMNRQLQSIAASATLGAAASAGTYVRSTTRILPRKKR